MTAPKPPADDEHLRLCEQPGCGFLVRWWFRFCPTHRPKDSDQ